MDKKSAYFLVFGGALFLRGCFGMWEPSRENVALKDEAIQTCFYEFPASPGLAPIVLPVFTNRFKVRGKEMPCESHHCSGHL